MKKVLSLIVIALLICCCGCKSSKVKPIRVSLSFSANIDYLNEKYYCFVTIAKNKDTTISFSHPRNINGLSITYKSDKITAEYLGNKTDVNSAPQYSVADIIYKAFTDDYEQIFADDYHYYIENKNLNSKMYYSQTGLPINIEENSSKFKVTITNATIIE